MSADPAAVAAQRDVVIAAGQRVRKAWQELQAARRDHDEACRTLDAMREGSRS